MAVLRGCFRGAFLRDFFEGFFWGVLGSLLRLFLGGFEVILRVFETDLRGF